jgi:outer membrane protein assembly factor BamB
MACFVEFPFPSASSVISVAKRTWRQHTSSIAAQVKPRFVPRWRFVLVCLLAAVLCVGFRARGLIAADATKPVGALPAANGTAWPVFRGDATADGVAHGTLPENLEVLWKFAGQGHGFEATVAIENGVVFAGCLDGNLYALALEDGKEKWKYHTELGFSAPAAVADGRVFAGDADGRFYCFDAATGKGLWGYETGGEIDSGPNFYKDKVLVGSQDATLYCFEAASGKLEWKHTIGDQIRCSPTVVEGYAFLAGCDGKLHIIDLEKIAAQAPDAIRQVEIDAPTGSTPGVGGDRVFFGTEGSTFFAIDWKEAKVVWAYKSMRNMPFRSSAAITGDAVIVGGRDKQVVALAPSDGQELWKFATKSRVDSSPVVVGSRVFVGSSDGRLYALDKKTGKKSWDYQAGGDFTASPAVADGRLVIGNTDGTLYCFGARKTR